MIIDRNKITFVTISCWVGLLTTAVKALTVSVNGDDTNSAKDAAAFEARIFSPRVDYNNEWRPVGRGDPLKNDPTFDYSPPALERVRYWADNNANEKEKKASPQPSGGSERGKSSKSEVLQLGVSSERMRQSAKAISANAIKNVIKETAANPPVKYTSIRRSYYAHQLPTRLMPPPMQTLTPIAAVKPSTTESAAASYQHYHQKMQYSSGATPSKQYYLTAVTSPWTAYSTHMNTHKMPEQVHDSHHGESINYVSITRPDLQQSNIRPSLNELKHSPSPRKPWVQQLLQRELIKPVKPTMPATKYLMHTTKPFFDTPAHPMRSSLSSPPTPTTTQTPIATPTTSNTTMTTTTTTVSTPVYVQSTTRPSTTIALPVAFTTPRSSTQFVIPTANSDTFLPTVASIEMTTDSLFSHYNQPEKPLIGPMYLIIEGHSNVKTYGQNDNDTTTHKPKIVPIISKREPIVHHVVSYDERGVNYQVKHLHTKPPTPATMTTTTMRTTSAIAGTMPSKETLKVNETGMNNPSEMQGLLSLLDSSLGNFFLNESPSEENSREHLRPTVQTKAIESLQPTIYVTTTERPGEDDLLYMPPSPRESRQIFDYDQLPESLLKELSVGGFSADGVAEQPSELWLRSSSSAVDAVAPLDFDEGDGAIEKINQKSARQQAGLPIITT